MSITEERLKELDVLRGFAVAVMILVVSPGSWAHTYAPLQHADWHGWTFADLVFPDFLFGVGMALGLTLTRSLDPAGHASVFGRKLFRRVAGLIALGLLLNFFAVIAGWFGAASVGPTDEVTWRLPGVLQRIALCYFLAVIIIGSALLPAWPRSASLKTRFASAAVLGATILLAGYALMLSAIAAPGFEAGDLTKAGNLPAWIDRAIFTPQHMWPLGSESWRGPVVYDPEGLLSTLPATANVLFGFLAIAIWKAFPSRRNFALLMAGVGLVAAGQLIDPLMPINKKLWTSSFALLTSGISFLALLLVSLLLRSRFADNATYPLVVLGGNALLAFSLSAFLSAAGSVPLEGGPTLQALGFDVVNRWILDPYAASLACAFGILALILAVLVPMHRKGIHLRI